MSEYIDHLRSVDSNGLIGDDGVRYDRIEIWVDVIGPERYVTCGTPSRILFTIFRSTCKQRFIYNFLNPIKIHDERTLLCDIIEALTEEEYQLVCDIRKDRDKAIMNIKNPNEYIQLIAKESLEDE